MQSGGIAGSRKLVKTNSEKYVGSRSLEGSSASDRLGLKGLFDILVL